VDNEWAGLALRARRRGDAAVNKVAALIAEETHQRVCDEVARDWWLRTHPGFKVTAKIERNREDVHLLPVKEEACMYP
jgi:hypothetical protein